MSARPDRKFRSLDVRPLIARGEEPFKKIMMTVSSLGPAEGMELISPFLPSPLIERMQSLGYEARAERATDGSWRSLFWKETPATK